MNKHRTAIVSLLPLSLVLCAGACRSVAAEPERPRFVAEDWPQIEGEPIVTVLPPDAIPAIDEPRYVSAAEAEAFVQPEETVLGVVGRNGTARAYSAWHLERHEIVNDVLDGEALAATW